jgi:DNA-binding CsgD family transcriptional regulator
MQLVRNGRCAAEATALLAEIASTQRPPSANGAASDLHAGVDALTNREFELLELLAAKMTNKEIAARLNISPHTVRNHTHQIYGKLNVASRRQAVQQARSRGLIR